MISIIPPVRQSDAQGAGYYGAPRGSRKHKGIDYACAIGSTVLSKTLGVVTKIGYPYNPNDDEKGHFRYVEVTSHKGDKFRYFYISPLVKLYNPVEPGDALGVTQELGKVYPSITEHTHFEIKDKNNRHINPLEYNFHT